MTGILHTRKWHQWRLQHNHTCPRCGADLRRVTFYQEATHEHHYSGRCAPIIIAS